MADFTQAAQQFQQILGRAPTQDEINYFSKHLDEGNLMPQEIGQILQSTPEYQNSQLTKNTAEFGDQLNAQNGAILDMAGAKANSRFAGLGRPNTSAMGASVMQAGGQLAQQRQSALASFYGQGLQNNANMAAQQGQGAVARAYGLRDATTAFGRENMMYNRQHDDFQNQKNASSGWKALTPEFLTGALINGAGKAAGAYMGSV